jgi:hypothetical protein
MSSDATDEACFEHMADDVDPQALVGRQVNFPVEALFGDDAMPEGCDAHAVSTIQSYTAGRRSRPACYDLLVTHTQWPLGAPGTATVFECQADDVHSMLSTAGFLLPPTLSGDGDGGSDGEQPDARAAADRKGKRKTEAPGDPAEDEIEWFGADGLGTGTGAQELQDLLDMETGAAALPAYMVSAYVTTPAGKVIHKQRLVAMLNMCPTMSNDRLQRIAQGTQHGDKDAPAAGEMEGGKRAAIQLGTRVFVSCYDKVAKQSRIWVGRVQKMGRQVEKRTIEYHRPVHLKRIPAGGFVYCHWYGQLPKKKNKWDYEVCDVGKFEMSQVRGLLKEGLTYAKGSTKQKPMMELCQDDYETYERLDEIELGNKKLFVKKKKR